LGGAREPSPTECQQAEINAKIEREPADAASHATFGAQPKREQPHRELDSYLDQQNVN